MKKSRRTASNNYKILACLILVFGFLAGGWFNPAGAFLSIKSGTKIAAAPASEGGQGIRIGLPQWNGQDFSIVPSGRVSIPLRELPVGWYPPRILPLPRDLDRDFDP